MTDFLAAVREAADGYEVYGELGRESETDIWFLARDLETKKLVALRLQAPADPGTAGGKPEYDLDVARELDASVSVGMGECPNCSTKLRRWARFCTWCGADLSDSKAMPSSPGQRDALLKQVQEAASEYYEVLGEMPWAGGGGNVYFALERQSRRLVRLRLKQGDDGASLGETRVLMDFKDRQVTAEYMTQVVASSKPSMPAMTPPPPAAKPAAARVVPRAPLPPGSVVSGSAKPTEREQFLTYAVVGLGVLVLILFVLLLRR